MHYVKTGQSYTCGSEFAVAKLDVEPIPEPASIILFATGLAGLVVRKLRKKK